MRIPEELLANLAFLMHRTANDYESYFDREMRALRLLRSQWMLLAHLKFCNGIKQKDLADMMSIGKGAIGKIARKLESSGWIERRPDANDGRAFNLYITAEAQHIVTRLTELLIMETDRSLLGFSAEETAFMKTAIGRIRGNIHELPPSAEWLALKQRVLADVDQWQRSRGAGSRRGLKKR